MLYYKRYDLPEKMPKTTLQRIIERYINQISKILSKRFFL